MGRNTLSLASLASLAILLAGAFSGLQCASADARPGYPSGPYPVSDRRDGPSIELVDDAMRRLPCYGHDGRLYVLGDTGGRYLIRVVNPTAARVEAVVSVDGLDAIDGHSANPGKRGYIIPAYGEVTIDGWRTSLDTVAAFRFSSVRDSYAGRTGHDRNVGVIGVAFFRERPRPVVTWQPPPPLRPSPARRSATVEDSEAPAGAGGAAGSANKSASAETAAPPRAAAEPADRAGLGTQFGETQSSRVTETTFVRASSSPTTVAELRYDDREGLLARGIAIAPPPTARDDENDIRDTAQAFPGARFAQPPP